MGKRIQMKDIPIKEVLMYQHRWSENNMRSGGLMRHPDKGYVPDMPFTYEALPYPEKVVYRVMEKLADQGYLEYGVSLRTAWLTAKGLKEIGELI